MDFLPTQQQPQTETDSPERLNTLTQAGRCCMRMQRRVHRPNTVHKCIVQHRSVSSSGGPLTSQAEGTLF